MAETVKLSDFALDDSNLTDASVISITGTGGGPFTNNRISFAHLKNQITSDLSSIYVNNNALTSTLNSYALQSWVTTQISNAQLAGGEADLTDYALQSWVNTEINDLSSVYLPLSGGTLTGNLNLGGNELTVTGGSISTGAGALNILATGEELALRTGSVSEPASSFILGEGASLRLAENKNFSIKIGAGDAENVATQKWVTDFSWVDDAPNLTNHIIGLASGLDTASHTYQSTTNPGATLTFDMDKEVVNVSTNANITNLVITNGSELKQNKIALIINNTSGSSITVALDNISPSGNSLGIDSLVTVAAGATEIIDLILVDSSIS